MMLTLLLILAIFGFGMVLLGLMLDKLQVHLDKVDLVVIAVLALQALADLADSADFQGSADKTELLDMMVLQATQDILATAVVV